MTGVPGNKSGRQIANWLLIGVGMILIQVLLGGITRLTESGLSITEWKPLTGALPPLSEADWQVEFDKYKGTDQFRYVHSGFDLGEFKFIFFWEWFHRLWARLMGAVFLAGFFYFLVTKKFNRSMILPMVLLFLIGGLQGAVGWLMVKSGLVPEKYFVGHIELTTHLMMALLLLCYTLWFALKLRVTSQSIIVNRGLHNELVLIAVILFFQLIYGGFMAGIKAAVVAQTWPDMNGYLFPPTLTDLSPGIKNIFYNRVTIHFIHRALGYLLFALVVSWWFKARKAGGSPLFKRLSSALYLLIIVQLTLGILTALNASDANKLIWLGVSHQFTGMLLVMAITSLLYITRRNEWSR